MIRAKDVQLMLDDDFITDGRRVAVIVLLGR